MDHISDMQCNREGYAKCEGDTQRNAELYLPYMMRHVGGRGVPSLGSGTLLRISISHRVVSSRRFPDEEHKLKQHVMANISWREGLILTPTRCHRIFCRALKFRTLVFGGLC